MRRFLSLAALLAALVSGCGPSTSAMTARDQLGDGGAVVVDRVVLAGHDRGWLIVRGEDGDRIGIAHVDGGVNRDVVVVLDDPVATTTQVQLVLHADDHAVGVYEYGEVDGADQPLSNPDGPVAERLQLRVG